MARTPLTTPSVGSPSWGTTGQQLFTEVEALLGARSGGVAGATARITCHIVTNQGREEDRTLRLLIHHR